MKLELKAAQKAKVVTKHDRPLLIENSGGGGSRIEMTRLVTPSSGTHQAGSAVAASSSSDSNNRVSPPNLDVVAMYEKRNKQLDSEIKHLR